MRSYEWIKLTILKFIMPAEVFVMPAEFVTPDLDVPSVIAIPGSRKMEYLEENHGTANVHLILKNYQKSGNLSILLKLLVTDIIHHAMQVRSHVYVGHFFFLKKKKSTPTIFIKTKNRINKNTTNTSSVENFTRSYKRFCFIV
jgi:hypothetical protein